MRGVGPPNELANDAAPHHVMGASANTMHNDPMSRAAVRSNRAVVAVALEYPWPAPPFGERFAVAPGVYWLRLPLPGMLDHINVWMLDDVAAHSVGDSHGADVAIVDTGIDDDPTRAIWQTLARHHRYTRVFATHLHADHAGLAGWLHREHGAALWMSRAEYLTARVILQESSQALPIDTLTFYRRAGWDDAALDGLRERHGRYGGLSSALPPRYRRLHDDEVIRIGAHDWRVIVGCGHSPEHACLYCPALKLLIAGDQVLPRISSNVSVQPREPEANPMADWLDSLRRLRHEVPDEVLVLPAHNTCFHGLHARIEQLLHGQQCVFERLRRRLADGPCRAIDVFPALFGKTVDALRGPTLTLATGESLACLNYLMQRGEVVRKPHDDGADRYALTSAAYPASLP